MAKYFLDEVELNGQGIKRALQDPWLRPMVFMDEDGMPFTRFVHDQQSGYAASSQPSRWITIRNAVVGTVMFGLGYWFGAC
jgi:hypothetical protein